MEIDTVWINNDLLLDDYFRISIMRDIKNEVAELEITDETEATGAPSKIDPGVEKPICYQRFKRIAISKETSYPQAGAQVLLLPHTKKNSENIRTCKLGICKLHLNLLASLRLVSNLS